MAGNYTEGQSQVLSGVYSIIKTALSRITAATRGIVAYPFTADWGPANTLIVVNVQNNFKALYNPSSTNLTANDIFVHAYKGNPQQLLAYRMCADTAKKAIASLGAASLQLETLYPTNRAFTVTVKDGTSGTKIITILENGVTLASVEDATLDGLYNKLNTTNFVRATAKGTELPANTAGVVFAGGNNGDAVTAAEYSAFLDELEADGTANAFSLDNVTDDAIIAVVTAWLAVVRTQGLYITYVNGGPASWDTDGGTAANAKSKTLNARSIVNVGNGVDGYTAAQLAIFVAARVASVALNASITDEVTPYSAVNKKLKPAQRVDCKNSGTLIFVQDGQYVVIDEGVNTLTVPVGDEVAEMGKIRINNTLDQVLKDLEAFGDEYKKDRSNTDEARQTYAATVEENYLKPLAGMNVLDYGYFYRPDPDYHGEKSIYHAAIDEAYFYADITPLDSMERIYQKVGVNF